MSDDVGCCVNWASSSITLVVDEAILILRKAEDHKDDVVNALSLIIDWVGVGLFAVKQNVIDV